jgi:YD repeat-containing protein
MCVPHVPHRNGYETSYTYDSDRRVTMREVAGVGLTTYAYTGDLNEFQEVTDAQGQLTTYSMGNGWKINGTIDPLGGRTSASYNAVQQQTERIDGLGNVWTTV